MTSKQHPEEHFALKANSDPIWGQLEGHWPAAVAGKQMAYLEIKARMVESLGVLGITPRAFSHFGVVVAEMAEALAWLLEATNGSSRQTRMDYVNTYRVQVARINLAGGELELIAPVGDSFFREHLSARGQGLQHLSFEVKDLVVCLETLKGAGVELIDRQPRHGSHGLVAFARPAQFVPLCLELCQQHHDR